MDQQMLTIFVAVTALAVVIQAGILVAMFLAMRKTSARMEAIADEVRTKALPVLDSAQVILADTGPKLQAITANLTEMTNTLRGQVERADVAMSDALDRARLQIIRADELVTRTMDKVEETTELVQHSVISPVRQISAVIQGITAGVGAFFGRRGRVQEGVQQDEEMFI